MASSTTTSIELRDAVSNFSETQPTNPDEDITQLSMLADSAVPEGGYGWVIVAWCAVIMFFFTGISYSWGVAQAALVAQGVSKASTLAFVGSLVPTCIAVFAILNARIIRAVGAQKTGLLGVAFLGTGNFLASFTTHNVAGLFVCVGIISGIGTRYDSNSYKIF
jgi:hypothetical protein